MNENYSTHVAQMDKKRGFHTALIAEKICRAQQALVLMLCLSKA